jgi:hypothetical protein
MHGRIVDGIVCVLVIVSGFGCRSVYRFRCTSSPSPAGVVVRERMLGETPCSIKIPRKSKLIQDRKIEFTFCLPDGREKSRIVDLHRLKPTNPLAEAVAAPFLLGGLCLLASASTDADSDESSSFGEEDKDNGHNFCSMLLGLGTVGIGGGLYALFGGHTDSLTDFPVRVDFNEPESACDQQTPRCPSGGGDPREELQDRPRP